MKAIRQALSSVESLRQVDAPARAVQHWLRRKLPDGPAVRALAGSWFGHPLHPIVVLMPVGAWLSVAVLDMLPGQQPAARKLVLTGVLTAAPAVLAGAVEMRELDERQRRVGFVHALSNLTATGCYLASYRLRRMGRIGGGRAWALAGLAAISAGGALGGHLTYAQGAGVFRWQAEELRPAAPEPATAR
jgi:hypothetical protein